jgi:hypothetical protein
MLYTQLQEFSTGIFPGLPVTGLSLDQLSDLVRHLRLSADVIREAGHITEIIHRVAAYLSFSHRERLRQVSQAWNGVIVMMRTLKDLESSYVDPRKLHVAVQVGDFRYVCLARTREQFRKICRHMKGYRPHLQGFIQDIMRIIVSAGQITWILDLDSSLIMEVLRDQPRMTTQMQRLLAEELVALSRQRSLDPEKLLPLGELYPDIIKLHIPQLETRRGNCRMCHMMRLCPEVAVYQRIVHNRQPWTVRCEGCRDCPLWRKMEELPKETTRRLSFNERFIEVCRAILLDHRGSAP